VEVVREFAHAMLSLLLGIPRQLASLLMRKRRLAQFRALKHDPLPASLPQLEAQGDRDRTPRILLSCGDASGEAHALRLLRELRHAYPKLEVVGFGGERLQEEQDMQVWQPLADLNVMGFKDVLAQLPLFFGCVRRFAEELAKQPPDLVLLIDYPGLNQHLLRVAHRAQIPVVDYIAPQLWAWAPWRVRDFRKADRLLTILPFESDWYQQHGAQATYIGHPLGDGLEQAAAEEATLPRDFPGQDEQWVGILPGSRKREIRENLPLLLEAAQLLLAQHPQVRFVLPHMRAKVDGLIRELLASSPVEVVYAPGCFHRALPHLRSAWVASGTALLEVAAYRIPPVLIYRVPSRLGAWLSRRWLAVPFIGSLNLVAGRELAPEHLGREISAEDLANDLSERLVGPKREQILAEIESLRPAFAEKGAARRTAHAICQLLK